MAEYNTIRQAQVGTRGAVYDEGLRAHMNKVYGLMATGMIITALAAWAINGLAVVDTDQGRTLTDFGRTIYASPLKWVIIFAPLAMVMAFGAALNRLSVSAATTMFYAFSALMGLSLSSVLLIYTGYSVVQTFLVTAIAFAGLSLYGYTTKRDLSGFGTFLVMGVIGLIVAMVVNMFLRSPVMHMAISGIGVLLFAALTAFDTQNIKRTYLELANTDSDFLGKAAIMGALQLYLDFINLFQFLLSFLGQRE